MWVLDNEEKFKCDMCKKILDREELKRLDENELCYDCYDEKKDQEEKEYFASQEEKRKREDGI